MNLHNFFFQLQLLFHALNCNVIKKKKKKTAPPLLSTKDKYNINLRGTRMCHVHGPFSSSVVYSHSDGGSDGRREAGGVARGDVGCDPDTKSQNKIESYN